MEDEWWKINISNGSNNSSNNSTSKCHIMKEISLGIQIAKHHGNEYQKILLEEFPDEITASFHEDFFPEYKGSDEVDGDHFSKIDINEFFVKNYRDLQKYAVGLDRIVKYPAKESTEVSNFKNAVRSLLYEICLYFDTFDITKGPDVSSQELVGYDSDMSETKYIVFSKLLMKYFMSHINYIDSGLNYFNRTECN